MNKTVINVPAGIRYISQWQGFKLNDFPHILDKKIPGCGFTEWCITNNENTIICSPRIILMKNKEDQHEGEVFRVKGGQEQDERVDKDLNRKTRSLAKDLGLSEEEEKSFTEKLTKDISSYFYKMRSERKPCKILVTYDSFRILRDVLMNMGENIENYRIIVDEFQSIFIDSRFKSSTEMDFVETLKKTTKVCFVSATPMIDTYLDRLDDFKFLPYYELDWETLSPGRIIKPTLNIKVSNSIIVPAKEIIEKYRSGQFEKAYRRAVSGEIKITESKEAVIYVNSVNNIINIIKNTDLKPNEVNILCANTDDNKKKIRSRLGKGFSIGRVLTQKDLAEGQKQKMFTFCTRTVYLGADFYSDNARSFILSDANIDCLAVDISLDLPQILGRQRWECNPWKNSAEFYYRPLVDKKGNKITKEKFLEHMNKKLKKTTNLITCWKESSSEEIKNDLSDTFEKIAKYENYKDDYVAVNRHSGPIAFPTLNNLVLVAEQRAFDVQQIDYKDRFSVFRSVDSALGTSSEDSNKEIDNFFMNYNSIITVKEKLRYLCESDLSELARQRIEGSIDDVVKNYLSLGKVRLKALGYDTFLIRKELGVVTFNKKVLQDNIYKIFIVGERYTLSNIKSSLTILYNQLGYKKTPKAIDLEEWFEIKDVYMIDGGKRVRGYKLIKKKGEGN